jgi:hypothetical protein
VGPNAQLCIPPPETAVGCDASPNPCGADQDPANTCTRLPDSGHLCTCSAGWATTFEGVACVRCQNVCATQDPCHRAENPANTCVFGGAREGLSRRRQGRGLLAHGGVAELADDASAKARADMAIATHYLKAAKEVR